MDDLKSGYRGAENKTKEVARELDGHDVTDDIGNMGDDIRKGLGDAGDQLRRGADDLGDRVGNAGDRAEDEADRRF
jgi:hypothetical protein